MIQIAHTVFIALAFTVSISAVEIQSASSEFFNAGIQGCISASTNASGAPLVIHNCNTEAAVNQDWQVFFSTTPNSSPVQQIRIFGDKCIDVTDGVNADGTKLQIWTCTEGNANQQWISPPAGGAPSIFQWNGTDKCLDLTDGNIADGNVLQIWTCSFGTHQNWLGEPNPDAVTQLSKIVGEGPYCIGATSDSDGAEVAYIACSGSTGNVTWTAPVSPLTGQLKTFDNKCLDVPNGSNVNGVKLQIWTCFPGNSNQMFRNSDAQIKWAGTGKCLDLTDGKPVIGNPIQLWDCAVPSDNLNQFWDIFPSDLIP